MMPGCACIIPSTRDRSSAVCRIRSHTSSGDNCNSGKMRKFMRCIESELATVDQKPEENDKWKGAVPVVFLGDSRARDATVSRTPPPASLCPLHRLRHPCAASTKGSSGKSGGTAAETPDVACPDRLRAPLAPSLPPSPQSHLLPSLQVRPLLKGHLRARCSVRSLYNENQLEFTCILCSVPVSSNAASHP